MFLVRFVDEGTRVESYLAVCFVLVYIFGDKKKGEALGFAIFVCRAFCRLCELWPAWPHILWNASCIKRVTLYCARTEWRK